jgi:hypothetical protein
MLFLVLNSTTHIMACTETFALILKNEADFFLTKLNNNIPFFVCIILGSLAFSHHVLPIFQLPEVSLQAAKVINRENIISTMHS